MKSNSDNIDKHKHTHRGSSHKQAACYLGGVSVPICSTNRCRVHNWTSFAL